jgi:colanic acid/amylovoran biosynthesis protein
MNIFIIQHYSPNKGDSAVLCSMLYSIQKSIPDAKIKVASFNPEQTYQTYGVDSVDFVFKLRSMTRGSLLKKLSMGILELLWMCIAYLWAFFGKKELKTSILSFERRASLNTYIWSDVVVCPGGHFFTNFNRFPGILSHYFALRIAQILTKPTMIYGHTIGPFFGFLGSITKIITRRVINRTSAITVREENSLDILNKLGVKPDLVAKTGESVFLMPLPAKQNIYVINEREAIRNETGDPVVGVTIHHGYFKYWYSKDEYVDLMARMVDCLVEEFNAKVVFVPMEYNRDRKGGDRPLAQEIRSASRYENNILVITADYSPLETMGIIGEVDMLIATKTHSVVFGLRMGVPTLAIAYQEKSREFMKEFDLEEFTIDLNTFDLSDFSLKVKKLWSTRHEVKEKIKENLPLVQLKASENDNILGALL